MFCVQSPGDWMAERDDGNCGIMVTKKPSTVGMTEETCGPADLLIIFQISIFITKRKAPTMFMKPETSKPQKYILRQME